MEICRCVIANGVLRWGRRRMGSCMRCASCQREFGFVVDWLVGGLADVDDPCAEFQEPGDVHHGLRRCSCKSHDPELRQGKVAKLREMLQRRSAKTRREKTFSVTNLVRVEVNIVT